MLFSPLIPQQHKILVIDDQVADILFLKEILSPVGDIYFANDGNNIIELLDKVAPDLILLDIEMPGLNGFNVCRTIKNHKKWQNIPIIFITASNSPEYEKLSLELGGIDFITKPINRITCRLRVENQLKLIAYTKSLKTAKSEMQQIAKQLPVLVSGWNLHWHNIFYNYDIPSWFGLPSEPKLGLSIAHIFPKEIAEEIMVTFNHNQDETTNQAKNNQLSFIRAVTLNKQIKYFQVYLKYIYDDKNLVGYIVTVNDISTIKQAKRALHVEKERLRITLNSIGDAVIATDSEGLVNFMNPVAERMLGCLFKDAKGKKIEQVMFLRDHSSKKTLINPIYMALKEQRIVAMSLNTELCALNGQSYLVEDSAAPIRNEEGEIFGAIIVFHDISETLATAMKMSHLANHDHLTDLPNRVLLHDRLVMAHSTLKTSLKKMAVLFVDIDHFKYLNDSLGHHIGDELISMMAKRITAILPFSATLARLGGDEFVILMPEINELKDAASLAASIVNAMNQPFTLNKKAYRISVSMGISVSPDDANDPKELLRHADVAMYRAKQEGRNRYCFFSNELEETLQHRYQIELRLREALEKDELLVHYQPKFNLKNRAIVGVEALVRLPLDDGKLVSPAEFIPIAEDTGLIIELGKQVLEQACCAVRRWLDLGIELIVAVNVAPAQFTDPELENQISYYLKKYNLTANILELEITESALMVDAAKTQAKLARLKKLGLSISIDDFGTGYSSLSYLKKFDVDIMKIDMSFVREMLVNKYDYEIVKTIIALGQSMDLTLVAEGVETEEHAEALAELGCPVGQGYLISKPINFSDMVAFIQNYHIN